MECFDDPVTLFGTSNSFNSTSLTAIFETCTNQAICKTEAEIFSFIQGFSLMLYSNQRTVGATTSDTQTEELTVRETSKISWFEFAASRMEYTLRLKQTEYS